jgi:hypothetical protein
VQVDLTMQAAKCCIETSSNSAHTVLAPESNVVVLVESREAEIEERSEAALLLLQLTHQETHDTPRQTWDQGSGAGDL